MTRLGRLVSIAALVAAPSMVSAATYYVRTDGGNATQCTGLANAAYPGSGNGQPCAWNHPFWALPPGGVQPPRLAGGDTLIVGPGEYMMGYGAPNTGDCDAVGAWDCVPAAAPSGPSPANRTRILGAGWDTGCSNRPQLWGTERASHVLALTGTSNAEVACLEITDHSGCIEFHSGGLACQRDTPPYGPWASAGLVGSDSANVTLRDLNIHGFSNQGVWAGRLTNWVVERVRIAHNGLVGWDGDIVGADGNTGTLVFRNLTVEWNGCAETYPGLLTNGCWAQSAGGYGDGVGVGFGGGTWIFEDARINFNTSDGLDLTYLHDPAARIELRRVEARGNAGNQVKTHGNTLIENSILVGNCGFFDGRPFTYNVDNCRAGGSTLFFEFNAGTQVGLVASTVYSEGDCMIGFDPFGCNGTESLVSRNNVFVGDTDFLQPFELTCFVWNNGCPGNPLSQDYGVIYNVKDNPCPMGGNDICSSPLLLNQTGDAFDAGLTPASPARDSGLPVGGIIPGHDFLGYTRPAGSGVDRGALEYGATDLIFADGFQAGPLPGGNENAPDRGGERLLSLSPIWR